MTMEKKRKKERERRERRKYTLDQLWPQLQNGAAAIAIAVQVFSVLTFWSKLTIYISQKYKLISILLYCFALLCRPILLIFNWFQVFECQTLTLKVNRSLQQGPHCLTFLYGSSQPLETLPPSLSIMASTIYLLDSPSPQFGGLLTDSLTCDYSHYPSCKIKGAPDLADLPLFDVYLGNSFNLNRLAIPNTQVPLPIPACLRYLLISSKRINK